MIKLHSSIRDEVTLEKRVYFIGSRYQHHAKHSGYEAYGHYVGTALQPPVCR